jgi:ABC-2 type transport system permease protein
MQETFTKPDQTKAMIDRQMSGLTDEVVSQNPELKHLKSMYSDLDKFMDEVDTASLNTNSPMQGPHIEMVEVSTIAERPKSSWEITFPQALLWALVGCASSFAVSMVVERTRGTFLRLRLAPISKMQILAGKGLACFIACVTVMAVLLTLGITIFDVRIGNPLILAAAVLCSAICFVGIMMAASVLGKTEQAVGGSSMAILLIFSMTGGGMIPLLFMPSWMQTVSNLSPAKWSILASEGAIWRGFSYSEMLLPLGVLISIGILGFAIGATILSKAYD